MFHHQIYAQIKNEKVLNIIVCANYEIANEVTRKTYGKESLAVECTYWDCAIGDTFRKNVFYSPDGVERQYKGSEVENIDALQKENEQLRKQAIEDNDSILDLDFRVTMLEG